MARPFLADPNFMVKASEGRANEINTCIGCNQACLDHTFSGKHASCLVNPRAGHETTLKIIPVKEGRQQTLAVVGAGPAGNFCCYCLLRLLMKKFRFIDGWMDCLID